jgi:hypothetical protein
MFSGSMGDLGRYRSAPPAAPAEPEPQPVADPAALAPEPTPEPPPLADPQPAPEPPQRFSLSGITSGFGLGSTQQPATRTQPADPAPVPAAPATGPTEARKIIDGTVDLPDALPEYAPEPLPEPAREMDLRMEEDEEFGFTEADLMPGIPAQPLPAASESSASEQPHVETAATHKAEPEDDPPPKPARRFNPWN